MDYKEIILKALRSIGCEPEHENGVGYSFKCEMLTFLYVVYDTDTSLLRFIVPNIFSVTDANRDAVLKMKHKVECSMKYVRFNIMDNTSLCATYDHYLASAENLEEVLIHMIKALMFATEEFAKNINGEK